MARPCYGILRAFAQGASDANNQDANCCPVITQFSVRPHSLMATVLSHQSRMSLHWTAGSDMVLGQSTKLRTLIALVRYGTYDLNTYAFPSHFHE